MTKKGIRSFAGVAAGCVLLLGCEEPARSPTNVAANGRQAARSAAAEPAERTIERLEREWATAHVRKDLGWFQRHVARDYRNVLTDGRIASRAEIIEHLKRSQPSQAIRVDQVDVRVHGDSAIATVTQSFTTASGKTGRSRITDVWVRSAGRWTVRHSHEGPLRS